MLKKMPGGIVNNKRQEDQFTHDGSTDLQTRLLTSDLRQVEQQEYRFFFLFGARDCNLNLFS